jgi:hypothetical protein
MASDPSFLETDELTIGLAGITSLAAEIVTLHFKEQLNLDLTVPENHKYLFSFSYFTMRFGTCIDPGLLFNLFHRFAVSYGKPLYESEETLHKKILVIVRENVGAIHYLICQKFDFNFQKRSDSQLAELMSEVDKEFLSDIDFLVNQNGRFGIKGSEHPDAKVHPNFLIWISKRLGERTGQSEKILHELTLAFYSALQYLDDVASNKREFPS